MIPRTRTIPCPLEGLGMVTVTYNMKATEVELDAFRATLLKKDAAPVVTTIAGWPDASEPLSETEGPLDFRYWVGWGGWGAATRAMLDDPLFSTPPKPGMIPTTPGK